MLTIVIVALFAGILLTHLLANAARAAILVVVVLGVVYLAHGVSFDALVDEGARALYNDTSSCHAVHPTRSFRL